MIKIHPELGPVPLKERAWQWLQWFGVSIEIKANQPANIGGKWNGAQRQIELYRTNAETVLHLLASAWWHNPRQNEPVRTAFIQQFRLLCQENDPRYLPTRQAARQLVADAGDNNDKALYAGLAGAIMGRLDLLPAYMRGFYTELFD